MRCPACSEAVLDKGGNCRTCGGIWLAADLVAERVPLQLTGGRYSERRCPVCDEKMDQPLVFHVPIDHCADHGMWFDKAELDEVLRRSQGVDWRALPQPTAADSLRMLVDAVGVWRTK